MFISTVIIETQSYGSYVWKNVCRVIRGVDLSREIVEFLKSRNSWESRTTFRLLYKGVRINENLPFFQVFPSILHPAEEVLHIYAAEIEQPSAVSRQLRNIRVLARNVSSCAEAYERGLVPAQRKRFNFPEREPRATIAAESLVAAVGENSEVFGRTSSTLKSFAKRLRDPATVGVELVKMRAEVQNTMDMLRYASNMHNLQRKLFGQQQLNNF